ncbi:hypothetical protein [Corynebacterium sp. sy039]|uniref:hypothetical protein n=1 Tax=Corynebacterium sp. sy039 TaxID=2599641 RepID=UPI001FF00E53|nr:hypothetical protein [Corynebacterium sp. sy039]
MTMTQGRYQQSARYSHVSRDYSAQTVGGVGTLAPLRHAPERSTPRSGVRTLPRPHREPRLLQKKAGSRQQFSYRGRRIVEKKKTDPHTVRFLIAITGLLIAGVFMSMMFSGWTTTASFELQKLTSKEKTLDNQIETLNRDIEQASATAEIARRAQEMKLVVPQQAGVLAADEHGAIVEQRPAEQDTRPIIDVNGNPVRASGATSDPAATREVGGNLNAVPGAGANSGTAIAGVAPYAAHTTASTDTAAGTVESPRMSN